MLKRSAAIVLAVAFISLAIAPETLAQQRGRRGGCDRAATSYSQSSYRGDDRSRYYAQPYSSSVAGTRYYSESNYRGGAGTNYYGDRYYGDRYYGDRYNNHSTRNLVLSVAAPAAVGAGIGAIVDGGKGAGIGALIGGGGGALVYLLEHKSRRR